MISSTMMDAPLTVPSLLERANLLFPDREIVSLVPTGFDRERGGPTPGTHRTTYGEVHGPRVGEMSRRSFMRRIVGAGVGLLSLQFLAGSLAFVRRSGT